MLFPTPTAGHDFYADVRSWLTVTGGELLRSLDKPGEALPDVDWLAAELYQSALDAGSRFILDGPGRNGIQSHALIALVDDQAEFVHSTHRRTRGRRWTSAQARLGGQKSKRPPKYTDAQLLAVADLSIRKQAHALGCSTATIKRIRRRLRTRFDVPLAEVAFEALLDSIPVPDVVEPEAPTEPVDALTAELDALDLTRKPKRAHTPEQAEEDAEQQARIETYSRISGRDMGAEFLEIIHTEPDLPSDDYALTFAQLAPRVREEAFDLLEGVTL
ncbi:hypothetical protein [Agromyces atrinae]|uniref:Uncharacterized protein n=1 Tax=Agromyces atrinae TaxID=592376 RepID=A0A4Q2M2X9_9MICO|nr:hypothetical protein [Agromyces atrinae]NYD65994.1 hypothetical protein [Agromyces atrinae]RXZ86324.1 hypothetical protein ESP50_11240 [Agromyces atrinae]